MGNNKKTEQLERQNQKVPMAAYEAISAAPQTFEKYVTIEFDTRRLITALGIDKDTAEPIVWFIWGARMVQFETRNRRTRELTMDWETACTHSYRQTPLYQTCKAGRKARKLMEEKQQQKREQANWSVFNMPLGSVTDTVDADADTATKQEDAES